MAGFSPVWQDLSGKFRCPVLSCQETHMPSPVEPYPTATDPSLRQIIIGLYKEFGPIVYYAALQLCSEHAYKVTGCRMTNTHIPWGDCNRS